MWLYAITIFLSAFLLFQVQPLIGKWILPWFGGGPAVWTTCMLFFQTALLGGYAYAHWLRTRLGNRNQLIVHLAVLVVAVMLLPIRPWEMLKPMDGSFPTWHVLLVLLGAVGLPYFALSSTSPLVQAWFSVAHPGKSPYRLYSLSNIGSLLALASYPFIVEPMLRLWYQSYIWSAGFVAFAVLCGFCAIRALRANPSSAPAAASPDATAAADAVIQPPGFMRRALWLALPACGSIMLLAITNQMCSDVGVVPFLWIIPLALYLLSFILVFHSDKLYFRPLFWLLLIGAAVVIAYLLEENVSAPMSYQIIGYNAALFVCCMVCHGELAKLRPHPKYLTGFYFMSSAGGAVGGLFVTILAPNMSAIIEATVEKMGGTIASILSPTLFTGYFELHVGLFLTFVLAAISFFYSTPLRTRTWWPAVMPLLLLGESIIVGMLGYWLVHDLQQEFNGSVKASRNFYGVLQVLEYQKDEPEGHHFSLQHGRILHGSQYVAEDLNQKPATYYGPDSGVGRAVRYLRAEGKPLKIAVVGLGTGTMASYGEKGDTVRFYEINTAVLNLSDHGTIYDEDGRALNAAETANVFSYFTYIKGARARGAEVDISLGDARLSMEREKSQQFDLIALDAFSSDAIPVHLLTAEAVEVYRKHLRPNGILAVHISNRFLDLKPVVLAVAEKYKMGAFIVDDSNDLHVDYLSSSVWVLVTDDKVLMKDPAVTYGQSETNPKARCLWTDDYSNLFRVVRWSSRDEDMEDPTVEPPEDSVDVIEDKK
jgi:hypothetical protein